MNYPYGKCRGCGERLFGHVDGGYRCHNCETRYPSDRAGDVSSSGYELDGASKRSFQA
ncbi:hypothetical protein [Natronococcus wangiae]|uniref:hypothetical protein n=1 Tax=Natronococcus wangiae TaxID=3068275 RepID=UPI00273E37D3|nr:hypothetical protein [Natronococcus sp. AD5]